MAAGHASRLQTGAAWGARPPGKTGPRSEPYRRYRCKLYNMQKLQSYKVNVEFSSLDMSRPYVRSIGSCLAGSPRSLLSCCRHGCRCHSYLLFMHACTVGLQGGGWRQHPLGSSHSIAAQGMLATRIFLALLVVSNGDSSCHHETKHLGALYDVSSPWSACIQRISKATSAQSMFSRPLSFLSVHARQPMPSFGAMLRGATSVVEIGTGDSTALLRALHQLEAQQPQLPESAPMPVCAVGINSMHYNLMAFGGAANVPALVASPLYPYLTIAAGFGSRSAFEGVAHRGVTQAHTHTLPTLAPACMPHFVCTVQMCDHCVPCRW